MKIALMMPEEWSSPEIALIERELGEVVGPWTAGVDVTFALSRLPSGRYYAWDREFGAKEPSLNFMQSKDLGELVEMVKEVTNDMHRV